MLVICMLDSFLHPFQNQGWRFAGKKKKKKVLSLPFKNADIKILWEKKWFNELSFWIACPFRRKENAKLQLSLSQFREIVV